MNGRFCGNCGAPAGPDILFCTSCGHPLEGAAEVKPDDTAVVPTVTATDATNATPGMTGAVAGYAVPGDAALGGPLTDKPASPAASGKGPLIVAIVSVAVIVFGLGILAFSAVKNVFVGDGTASSQSEQTPLSGESTPTTTPGESAEGLGTTGGTTSDAFDDSISSNSEHDHTTEDPGLTTTTTVPTTPTTAVDPAVKSSYERLMTSWRGMLRFDARIARMANVFNKDAADGALKLKTCGEASRILGNIDAEVTELASDRSSIHPTHADDYEHVIKLYEYLGTRAGAISDACMAARNGEDYIHLLKPGSSARAKFEKYILRWEPVE